MEDGVRELALKALEGTASSLRWTLASLLAVHGGALVALMQAGVDRTLIGHAGWYFIGGLGLTLVAGFVLCGFMVMALIALPGGKPKASDLVDMDYRRLALLFGISGALLVTSLLLAITGFVVVELSLSS